MSSKGTSDSRHQLFFNVGCVFTYFLEVFFSLLFYFRLSNSKSKRKAGVPAIVAFLPFLSFTANYMFQEPLVMAVFFFRVSLQLLRENQDTHIRWELSLETSLSTIYNGPFSFSFFAHPLLRWRFIERRKKKRVFFPFFYYCYSSATKHKHTHTHTHLCFLGKMFMVSMLYGACLRLRYFDMLKCRNDEKKENVRLFRFSLDLNSLSRFFLPSQSLLASFFLSCVCVTLLCFLLLFFLTCFYTWTMCVSSIHKRQCNHSDRKHG